MKNSVKQILLLLSKKLYAVYIFLKENGFFDELIRGMSSFYSSLLCLGFLKKQFGNKIKS